MLNSGPISLGMIHGCEYLCYTVPMDTDQQLWRVWINALSRWGVRDWVASFLEAAGPLAILGAQMVYVVQPILNLALPENHVHAAARLLEEPVRTRAFVELLREAPSQ